MKSATPLFFGLLLLTSVATAQIQFTYSVGKGGVTINGYYSLPPEGDLIIPPTLDGLPVVAIADDSFSGLSSVTNASIPAGITNIGDGAFAGCASLTAIEVDPQNSTYTSSNGVLFNKNLTALVEFPSGLGGSYTIPDGVTTISVAAFQQCFDLTNIVIPASVETIEDFAFESCVGITNIAIPDSVSSIGVGPFSGCASLTNIAVDGNNLNYSSTNGALFDKNQNTLIEFPGGIAGNYTVPYSVKSIFTSAFENCPNLGGVTIPASVTNIGIGAFFGCSQLKNITVSGMNSFFSSTNGVLFDSHQATLLDYPPGLHGSFSVPTMVTSIAEDAFQDCLGLTEIQLPAGLLAIESNAFYNCLNLTGVTIPGSVGSVGVGAFENCTRLSVVAIDTGVGNIESNAFENCYSLVSASIPGSVTNIGEAAFEYCLSLPGIKIPAGVTAIGDEAFEYCSGMTGISIANTVSTIGQEAFAYCSGFSSVTLPSGLTSIAPYTFYECAGLTQMVVPSNVASIGAGAFDQCYDLASVTISAGVSSIGDSAFNDCTSLAQISVPSSVTSIGVSPFSGCASLVSINMDGQNPLYSSVDGVLLDKNQTTIIECPNGLTGSYTIPTSITQLGDYAFLNCSTLTNIIIPDSVTRVGQAAFENCTGLAGMNFPVSVTSIGANAFYGAGATNFYFAGNAPTANPTAFDSIANTMVYYLPGSSGWAEFSVNTGAPATPWNAVIQVSDGGFGVNNNQFGFNVTGSTNLLVVIEACTNLVNPVWTPIETVALGNGLFHFTEPVQTNSEARFFGLGWP